MNFYNEYDPAAAAWLRELIAQKLIPDGVVDERSITEIQPHELSEFTQCHFFCGIAGWPLALQIAGVDPSRPLGTGSCPCQPYSAAGKGLGDADPRNLWPVFFRLIIACRNLDQPWAYLIFGEQVESAVGHGWLDGVSADLEGEGYAIGAVVLGAHSVGAPHIRQRLYWGAQWLADAELARREASGMRSEIDAGRKPESGRASCGLANSLCPRPQGHAGDGDDGNEPGRLDTLAAGSTAAGGAVGGVADTTSLPRAQHEREPGNGSRGQKGPHDSAERGGDHGGVVLPNGDGRQPGNESAASARHGDSAVTAGFWSESRWLLCRDGKHRRIPTQSVHELVVDGLSGLMGAGWDRCLEEIQNKVNDYAKNTKTDTSEILYSLWSATQTDALQRQAGGHDEIPFPEFLLLGLFELTRNQKQGIRSSASDIAEIKKGTLRVLRKYTRELKAPSRPSSQRELVGSQPGESSDALRGLSPQTAPGISDAAVPLLLDALPPSRHVPEALPAIHEIWRRHADKGQDEGFARDLCLTAGIISASGGFPLASAECFKVSPRGSVRPALLKGAGNAIVPETAAEFLKAFLES